MPITTGSNPMALKPKKPRVKKPKSPSGMPKVKMPKAKTKMPTKGGKKSQGKSDGMMLEQLLKGNL